MNPNNFDAFKLTDRTFATIGDILTYTIVLTNNGTIPNVNINLTDLVPQGANFINNSIFINNSNILGANPALGVTIPNMAASAITTVTFQAQVTNVPGLNPMQNAGQIDYQFTPNTLIMTTCIYTNTVLTTVNAAVMTLTKTAPTTSSIGQIITFTIAARNIGNVTANNLFFIDTIPVGTVFIPGSVNINNVTLPAQNPSPPTGIGPLTQNPNQLRTIRFQVQVVSSPPGNIINNTMFSTYSYLVDPVTIRNVSTLSSSNITTTTLAFANLSGITKSVNKRFATCGDILIYVITVPNSGPTTATNVIITDTLSNGLSYIPGTLFVDSVPRVDPLTGINVGTIVPGGISTVTFQAQIIC